VRLKVFLLIIILFLTGCSKKSNQSTDVTGNTTNNNESITEPVTNEDTIILFTENTPPYNWGTADGEITGFSVELIREILRRNNAPDTIQIMPFSRGFELTRMRKNHAIFSLYRENKRIDLFKWVGPLVDVKVVFLAKRGSGIQINTLGDAKKYFIGVQKDSGNHDFLVTNGFTNLDVTAESGAGTSRLEKLLIGRFDLWMASEISAREKARLMGIDPNQLETVFVIKNEPFYIAFNLETDDTIIEKWQKTLNEIKQEPFYNDLQNRFLRN